MERLLKIQAEFKEAEMQMKIKDCQGVAREKEITSIEVNILREIKFGTSIRIKMLG